jgi:pimeloyl-ACP methyl ester carboxylesterase
MPQLPGARHTSMTLSTGLRMHVAEAGQIDAPAVLLLHGFPKHWWEGRRVISFTAPPANFRTDSARRA